MTTIKETQGNHRSSKSKSWTLLALASLLALAALTSGCTKPSVPAKSAQAQSAPVGHSMAGAAQDVYIEPKAIAQQPKPADLKTPESAVRSYLDWVSYAYRVSNAEVAKNVMTSDANVYIDSYVQYNLEKGRLLDQHLTSITFGTPSTSSTGTVLPAKESWSYSYLSIKKGNASLGGPYTANYDTTYTLTKTDKGAWEVAKVKAVAKGTVK